MSKRRAGNGGSVKGLMLAMAVFFFLLVAIVSGCALAEKFGLLSR